METEVYRIAKDYINQIKSAQAFMRSKFGDVHFLREKNAGNIPSSQLNIKNSTIKSFDIHGRGCGFRTKKFNFEIEFDLDSTDFGFTAWTLYLYIKTRLNITLDESQLNEILNQLIKEFALRRNGQIVYVNSSE